MRTLLLGRLSISVAACALLLSACGSNGGGLSLGAGSGGGSGVTTGGRDAGGGGSGNIDKPTSPDNAGDNAGSGGGSNGDGGSGNGGGDNGSGGNGGGSQAANTPLGNGLVTITADGTTVSSPPLTGNAVTGGVFSVANTALNPIVTAGNALLPSASLGVPLPLQAKASGTTINGVSSEPVGLGLLAPTTTTGTVASLNLLSGGKTAAVSILPKGTTVRSMVSPDRSARWPLRWRLSSNRLCPRLPRPRRR